MFVSLASVGFDRNGRLGHKSRRSKQRGAESRPHTARGAVVKHTEATVKAGLQFVTLHEWKEQTERRWLPR